MPTAGRPFRLSGKPHFLQSPFEKMDGSTSQQIQSNGFAYEAGVYQQVTGCAAGKRYRFAGWLCTGYDHAFSVIRHSPDGVMVKRIGVDPKGGLDPKSPNVVWSWKEPMDRRWRRLMVDFSAKAKTVTVFARVTNTGKVGYDLAWLDVFEFCPSDYVRISSPDVSPSVTSATITWETDLASDSKVRYWKWQTTDVKDKNPKEATGGSGVKRHSVTLSGLSPGTKYYFEVVSKAPGVPAVNETIAGGREFSTNVGAKDSDDGPCGGSVMPWSESFVPAAGEEQVILPVDLPRCWGYTALCSAIPHDRFPVSKRDCDTWRVRNRFHNTSHKKEGRR